MPATASGAGPVRELSMHDHRAGMAGLPPDLAAASVGGAIVHNAGWAARIALGRTVFAFTKRQGDHAARPMMLVLDQFNGTLISTLPP